MLTCLMTCVCAYWTWWGQAWDQERTVRPVRPSAGTGGTRTKVARMSQAQGKGPTASQAAGGAQTHGDSGTYTKALMLVDSLLHDGSFSTAQAQKMRWMCMWRQPPITVLIKAYGTNPELFAIRCQCHPPPVLVYWFTALLVYCFTTCPLAASRTTCPLAASPQDDRRARGVTEMCWARVFGVCWACVLACWAWLAWLGWLALLALAWALALAACLAWLARLVGLGACQRGVRVYVFVEGRHVALSCSC